MEYTTLGGTGVTVSRLCLGCMTFGTDESTKYPWSIDKATSAEIIERAIDLGINFFDTANSYSYGDSERVLGRALAGYDRDKQVVASKVRFESSPDAGPNGSGLSRKTIEQELRASLKRLGMETLDLYQIHRWDDETPIEETLLALDDAVRRNQVRYLGASSMWAHQFAEALHTSDRLALERFATMQNHYNLVYREEEREMLPLCRREGIGVIPWSPLAAGFLARPHDEQDATRRGRTDEYKQGRGYRAGAGEAINERVEELANEKGVSMTQLSLAWLLHQEGVDAPIIGTTSVEHLKAAVAALGISLDGSDLEYLESAYVPRPVSGHD